MLTNGLHLTVLSAFALAQPLLDILGRNPTFFVVRDSSSGEIVAFALVLTLLPPVLLGLVELAAGLLSRRLLHVLHLALVGGLVALFTLTSLKSATALTGVAALALAAAAAACAVVLYARARALRSFLTVLTPVPLVFLLLFLVNSPVSELVFAETPPAQATTLPSTAGKARTPVVFILFDELSTVSLMDRNERIDARRYPSFAALAGDATWYRNHTSMYWLSEGAVPSILTGRLPDHRKVPVLSDYPGNLFTLLGPGYRINATESITRLCPARLCRAQRTTQVSTGAGESGALPSDVGIVYLHLLLPEPYDDRLPRIDASWGNFGQAESEHELETQRRTPDIPACGRSICDFTDVLERGGRPTLHFLHTSLPHVPYVYLPSGRRYVIDSRPLRGNDNGRWVVESAALQSYQRYLLQTAYTDRALGHILRKLKSTGLYDRALILVSADHGVSFKLGDHRRLPTLTNLDDIAFVPFFVKLPGQRRGRTDDSLTRSIDILPTIADVLGVQVPWRVDGRSLNRAALPTEGSVTMYKQGTSIGAPLSSLRAERARTLWRQVEAFGDGPLSRVYGWGPHPELVGRRVADFSVRVSESARVRIDNRSLYEAVDPSAAFLPAFVEGRVEGRLPAGSDLAIALNGRIATVTEAYKRVGQRRISFSTIVPDAALLPGRNTVDVYVVGGAEGAPILEEIRSGDVEVTLVEQNGAEAISLGAGREIPVRPEALRGMVRVARESTGYSFTGRAASANGRGAVDTLVVFVGDRAVFTGRAENMRPKRVLGEKRLGEAGFAFELPRGLLPEEGSERVRVFATRGGVATELGYGASYPWPHDG